jgi:DNA mismatch repair protein PMS2
VFSTHANATTRENIANVFSAKALISLLPLDLKFELQPSTLPSQSARNWNTQSDVVSRDIQLLGYISRPVVGEGRQTPDRQMFFVNSRPCALPQVAKAINEVYRSYNVTQSPFIFANLKLDTNSYDVNVSPDKRTILLHDQTMLLEALKSSLIELFESHEQSVPQSHIGKGKQSSFTPLTINREVLQQSDVTTPTPRKQVDRLSRFESTNIDRAPDSGVLDPRSSLIRKFAVRDSEKGKLDHNPDPHQDMISKEKQIPAANREDQFSKADLSEVHFGQDEELPSAQQSFASTPIPISIQDFNRLLGADIREPERSDVELASNQTSSKTSPDLINHSGPYPGPVVEPSLDPAVNACRDKEAANIQDESEDEEPIPSTKPNSARKSPGVVQNAFDRMRPQRASPETATVTIGNTTTVTTIGSSAFKRRKVHKPKFDMDGKPLSQVNPVLFKSLRAFAAPGTILDDEVEMDDLDLQGLSNVSSSGMLNESSELFESELDETEEVVPAHSDTEPEPSNGSDDEYIDDDEKKAREEAKVAKMIAAAEEAAARPSADNMKKASSVLKKVARKDATLQLLKNIDISTTTITDNLASLQEALVEFVKNNELSKSKMERGDGEGSAEEQLALTVSKSDFGRMRIVGQFNLGFILAIRPQQVLSKDSSTATAPGRQSDELFIIDQHASDEKYNFERLQTETAVQNQQLVLPKPLDLTAVEEEIILNHPEALAKNGFSITCDLSGDLAVGRRCQLVSLPMSKEVVFDLRDLEELLGLLSDPAGSGIPRPSKVRKMFAMRACRSSIMVGKTLTPKQMEKVVTHMGEIDKPWNCPHGRPTMRHLYGLDAWQSWTEGDGLAGMDERLSRRADWTAYLEKEGTSLLTDEDDEEEDEGDVDEEAQDWLHT